MTLTPPGDPVDGFIDALLDDQPDQLYERAPCGYLSTTPDGMIVKVNETFLRLTGYARADLVGRRRFAELLSPGGKIYHETHYAPLLRGAGTAREIALDLVRPDGSRLPVLVNAVLERDAAGAAQVIRTAVFDATHRREYERELFRQKERAEASEAHANALARTLQQTLIPPAAPRIDQLDVAAQYRPAGDGSEVGGDFYDIFQTGPADWVISIGDVCGKGVQAAVVTALVRHTLRAAAIQDPSPLYALTRTNAALRAHSAGRFCTVAFVRLRRIDDAWQVWLGSGGHPLPLLRSRDGTVTTVGRPGLLLGVFDDLTGHETRFTLEPGETLLLYTDGVPEGARGGQFYGEERLGTVLSAAGGDAAELTAAVLDDVLSFQDGTAYDDIALVAVQVPESTAGRRGG